MVKIAIIGAGSHVFARRLITDILSYPELQNSTLSLMDINPERLQFITAFAHQLITQQQLPTQVESTTSQRTALEHADYVIVSIRVGGYDINRLELEIPAKYGIIQGVGDTIGPGGVFYGLRHIPALLNICQDMDELCPRAWLLNYTNPMAIICWAVNDYTTIQNIGLCHSVQGTAKDLARYLGASPQDLEYWVAGINHMAWFLRLHWQGNDAYPMLRAKFQNPHLYSHPTAHWAGPDIVRVEIFKAFGYFNTESSQHMSEYVPYFRKQPELFEKYKLRNRLDWLDEGQQQRNQQDLELQQIIQTGASIPLQRSQEYCSSILYGIETDSPQRIYANVKNNGLITNLLDGSCVEVPCLVDGSGIHPCYIGALPPQCAALNRTNINVQELTVLAAIEKEKSLVYQALLLDPLTSSLLTIEKTQQMADELFKVEYTFLHEFK
jgi:alpha-galactosidase